MKLIKKILIIGLTLLMLTGCVSKKKYVAYTIYPIGYLLDSIGGNKIVTESIQTNNLVQKATLKDNYKEILNNSLILFHLSGLEPYMDLYKDEIIDCDIDLSSGDLSILNYIYGFKRYTPVVVSGVETFVESDFYDSDNFEDINVYDYDPFIWLSPSGMLSLATDIYKYLASNYVEQSAYFKENFDKISDALITLDANYKNLSLSLVKENKSIKFVSLTPGFSSWQKDFGIQIYPVCLSKYGTLPSDSQLEIIKQRIIKDNVHYIVYEPNMSDEMNDLFLKLEQELSLKRVTLDSLSSLSEQRKTSGKDYLSIMYENLTILENMKEDNNTGESNGQ